MKDTFEVPSMMTKEDVTMMILSAKKTAGLTWEEIAEKIDMSPVFTHSASMGMNAFPKDKAELPKSQPSSSDQRPRPKCYLNAEANRIPRWCKVSNTGVMPTRFY